MLKVPGNLEDTAENKYENPKISIHHNLPLQVLYWSSRTYYSQACMNGIPEIWGPDLLDNVKEWPRHRATKASPVTGAVESNVTTQS